MSVVVTIDVVGARVIEEKFEGWGVRASDPMPAYGAILESMMIFEKEMFATEGAISGDPWPELSEETERTKAEKDMPSGILVATGALEDSLTSVGAEGQIAEITPEYLRFGTDIEGGAYAQSGTTKEPVRKVLNFREQDLEAFSMIVYLYVVKGIVSAQTFQL